MTKICNDAPRDSNGLMRYDWLRDDMCDTPRDSNGLLRPDLLLKEEK